MPRHRVLVTAPYMQQAIDRFLPELEAHGVEVIVAPVEERLAEDELLSLVGNIDGVICGDDRFTERVLSHAPRLRVIAKWGTGIDSIDVRACRQRGIAVCNTPRAFTDPVADSVLGYLLAFARRQNEMDAAMKSGTWKKIPGHALRERTLGIIGVGEIGKAVVRRAHAFGMRVLGNDVTEVSPSFIQETGGTMVGLEAIYHQADYISINCDLNESSRKLVDASSFSSMEMLPVLINTARGSIVDETALIGALLAGQISGAALDVFEREPLPLDSPLRNMDNVMLAPHNANSSPVAWDRVHRRTVDQLLAALGGT